MLDLRHVKTFLAIQQKGSFSAAAEHLDIAQPTVSLHIKSLEASLGYKLFDRIGRDTIVTPAGNQFSETAYKLLKLTQDALSIGHDQKQLNGTINLCVVQSICTYKLPAVLKAYRRLHPDVQFRISVNRPSTYMLEQLRKGEFDAAVVLEAPFDIPSLNSKPLWSDQLSLIAPSSHFLTRHKNVSMANLQNETFIFPEATAHYRRLFERRLQEQNIDPRIGFEIDNMEAIKKAVIAGLGLAILPHYAVEAELATGILAHIPLSGRKLKVTARAIWHKEKLMSPAAEAFIDMMVKS
ncbi:MAG: LysR family transcriptional regulator [Chloroflexota bacterium]